MVGLYIERYSLKDVVGRPILIGVVNSVASSQDPKITKDSRISFSIEKIVGPETRFQEGTTRPLIVYGGLVWDDPQISPIDHRLRGSILPAPGVRVMAVPCDSSRFELLPVTEERMRVLSLLWNPEKKADWLAGPDTVLVADLANGDLARPAAEVLEQRGALTTERLLTAEEEFLTEYVHRQKIDLQIRIFREAAAPAIADPSLRDRVLRLAFSDPHPAWIADIAPLMAQVDPTTEAGRNQFSRMHFALVKAAAGTADLSPFSDFLIRYERHRPDDQSTDDDLEKLTPFMDARAKAAIAVGFVASARTSTFAREAYDWFLLRQAARLVKEAPDASILDALSRLPVAVTTNHRLVADPLLEMGGAIFTAFPSERARVQELLGPWIALETPPSREALARYAEVLGEGRDAADRRLPGGLLGFFEAARLATSAPAPWLVDALARLDPQGQPSYESQVMAMGVLLDACSTLVAALPDQRGPVQETIQPRIEADRNVPRKDLQRYLEVVGEPPRGAPEAATFDLAAGELKRLPTALHIQYEKVEDGKFRVSFTLHGKGVGWRLSPAAESYREAWVAPYIVTAHRTASSGDRIRISVIPQTAPPTGLQDPEGCRMAKPLAQQAGCPDCEDHECRHGDGCFEYRATGPDGKKCTILIGTLTRQVISTT